MQLKKKPELGPFNRETVHLHHRLTIDGQN